MVIRSWKVRDFCCLTDSPTATLYRIKELEEYTALLVYYNLLTGVEYNGGYMNLLSLRRPTHEQFVTAISEHLQEIRGDETPVT